MKLIKAVLIVSIILASCGENKNNFTIKGTIHNGNGHLIYIKEMKSQGLVTIDSTMIEENGAFVLKGNTQHPGFYSLEIEDTKPITLIIHANDKIKVESNISQMGASYKVEGSKGSRLIKELITKLRKTNAKVDSLGQVFQKKRTDPEIETIKHQLDSTYKKAISGTRQYILDLIRNNPESLASLMALYQRISPNQKYIDYKEYMDVYAMVDSLLMQKHPESESVQNFHEQYQEARANYIEQQKREASLAIGKRPPDISLPTPEGDTLSLYNLEGNYVLLDFWAAWCQPCRRENPQLVQIYNKYHTKGFEIFQVSLDQSKKSWSQAIKQDNIGRWAQVSDLQYWQSSVVPVYNITKIPTNFLLDKELKIIAKDLRGNELKNRLSKIFGY
jgi:peroxiredoxin